MPALTLTQARHNLKALRDDLPRFQNQAVSAAGVETRLRRERADLDELSTAKTRATAAHDLLAQIEADISEAAAIVDDLERQADDERRRKAAAATLADMRAAEGEFTQQLGDLLGDVCKHIARLGATRQQWRVAAHEALAAHTAAGGSHPPVLKTLLHARAPVPADFLAFAPKGAPTLDGGPRPREVEMSLPQLPDFLHTLVVAMDAGRGNATPLPYPKESTT
jgi:hypothetical protein